MHVIQLFALLGVLILILAGSIALLSCMAAVLVNVRLRQLPTAVSQAGIPAVSLVLRTLFSSFLGSIYALLTSVFNFPQQGLHPESESGPDRQIIVLIHGLYHNRKAWILYSRWLRKAGFHNIYTWSYFSFGRDFKTLSQDLIQDLHHLANTHPEGRIVLIGHSLGGLLIKSVLTDPVASERIGLVITLGTPHQGTVLAQLALGRLGQSLQFGSEFVHSLAEDNANPSINKVSIYPPLDTMVAPIQGLRPIESGWTEILTPPVAHISLLFHRPTARRIKELIANCK
jgi:pimeloyl-ACP methyl ester carboxylesterase